MRGLRFSLRGAQRAIARVCSSSTCRVDASSSRATSNCCSRNKSLTATTPRASSSSPASTTMRCGSGTTAVSPAAWRTGGEAKRRQTSTSAGQRRSAADGNGKAGAGQRQIWVLEAGSPKAVRVHFHSRPEFLGTLVEGSLRAAQRCAVIEALLYLQARGEV